LSGPIRVELKPKSAHEAKGMTIKLQIQHEKKDIELTNGQDYVEKCPKTGDVLVEMKRYSDNVYSINFPKEMLQVITDGLRIEIIAPQLVHGRTCGLCGDFNGENTADLKTPRQCIMKKDRYFAYSYMLNKEGSSSHDEQCSGIPHSDREEYRRESQECIKKEEIFTPLSGIYRRLYALGNPTTSVHLVKKQANQVCISREKVNICPRKTHSVPAPKTFLQGSMPVQVKPKTVEFSCLDRPSQKAFSLERRAKRGDNLQAELHKLAVHFTTTEYEPVLCKAETDRNVVSSDSREDNNDDEYNNLF
jgi:hypothetical protein